MFSILWLTLWLSAVQARSVPARASIEGMVVRAGAVADAPRVGLGNARIDLKPGSQTSFTTSNGTFSFRNLEPGQYTIFVRRDGYVLQEDPGRGLTSGGLTVTLAAGQVLKNVMLPMIQAPVITGKVFDPHGDPLAAALVRAYRRRYTPYGTRLRATTKGMTNDLGEFRLFGLNFADYFVSAGYGDRDRAAAIGKVQLSANVARADDGFATAFYDSGSDLAFAKPAHLAPGADPVPLNIYLVETARFKIRGKAVSPEGGATIMLAPKGSDLREADRYTGTDAAGNFEINGVSPGAYVVWATSGDGAFSSDIIPLTLTDADIDGMRVSLMHTLSFSGSVSSERGILTNVANIKVTLICSNPEFDQEYEVLTGPDGRFTFENVAASPEYDVAIDPVPSGMYVERIHIGGISLLQGKMRLSPLQEMLIVLGRAPDSLDVRVMKGADPIHGAQVVLIPEPSFRRRADRYITGFTDQFGNLHLAGVPPGRYTAHAFEHIESEAFYAFGYNPALESRFKDRSVSLTVGDNSTRSIQLTVIPAAETAGWQ